MMTRKLCGYSAADSAHSVEEAGYLVEPFHLHIKVLNKEEVLKRKAGDWFSGVAGLVVSDEVFASVVARKIIEKLPEKAHEKAGIQFELRHLRSESHGTFFVMAVQLKGITWEELGTKALGLKEEDARDFAFNYNRVMPALLKMDMEEKATDVEQSVYRRVRWKAMVKMDASLAAELLKPPHGLKISLEVPELQTESPPPSSPDIDRPDELGMARSAPFLLRAEISNRELLLEDKQGLKKMAAKLVPDKLFDKIVEKKLEKQIPALLEERAGIVAQCRRVRRRDGRKEHDMKDGVLVQVVIMAYTSFPPTKLLSSAKGDRFAEGFAELWKVLDTLEKLGLPGMCFKMKEIGDRIRDQVRAGVTRKLQEALRERLHAEVTIQDGAWEGSRYYVEEPSKDDPMSNAVSDASKS